MQRYTRREKCAYNIKVHLIVETNDNFDQGKCGFGGSTDTENGFRTAKGGINKDRLDSTYSPHHYLHYKAFYAARRATEQFLVDRGMICSNYNIILFLTYYFVYRLFFLEKKL